MTMARSENLTFKLHICGWSMILRCTIFLQDEVVMDF
jgi:hypothetical protein